MRTTVTLDSDTESVVRRLMQQRGISFKQALNDAIRAGAMPAPGRQAQHTSARNLGTPLVDLTHALEIDATLEDEERLRRMRAGR